MKSSEKIKEILEAFDLTGGLRGAAQLAGCDHKTVAHYVALRDVGHCPGQWPAWVSSLDGFLDKIEEWVERSAGRIRADVAHDKLVAMGFTGSEPGFKESTQHRVVGLRVGDRSVLRRVSSSRGSCGVGC